MIVWNMWWLFLVLWKLIRLAESGSVVDFMDLILDDDERKLGEDEAENSRSYIRFLNTRNEVAKSHDLPFRATKSAPEMEEGRDKYCEPGCVRTGIWMESNHKRLGKTKDKFYEKPPSSTAPCTCTVAPTPCDCNVCYRTAFTYTAAAISSYCSPFDNPELKIYLDGEFQKVMGRIGEAIKEKLKEHIPKTTVNESPNSTVDHNYAAGSNSFPAQMNKSEFLFSRSGSDIKIYCGDKEYPAHRIILASKSSVFKAMFSTNMEENITGKLKIEDSTPEVVEDFLRFIYTGSVESMEENAAGIFSIAEKYDLPDLKTISENYLIRSVSVDNVLERYALGKFLSSDAIIKKSIEIMKMEKAKIWTTKEEFFEDCKKFPELFNIVFA